MEEIRIVFDGPPGPEGSRFIEVEDASGKSIAVGQWVENGKVWELRITKEQFLRGLEVEADNESASERKH